jgi:hypothetical protein
MQPDLILTPFGENAAPGTIDPIPETRGPGDDPQQATWDEGFPLVTMTPLGAGGIPPKGQDFNGVLNAISEHTVFTGRGGQYKWSTAYVTASGGYSIGDVIQADDGLNSYVSLVNANTANFNTTPAAIGVSWGLYAGRNTQVQSTETVSGIAEIATQAEVTTGADDARIVTPAKLRGAQATQAEAEAGTDNTTLMTPLRARQQRDKAGFAIDTGTANTYVCAFTPAITARLEGQVLKFKVNAANTGASTLNDGAGVVALVGGAQTALQGGELVANGDAWVQWNTSVGGGSYILLFCTGAPEQVAPATKSQHAAQLGQLGHGQCRLSVGSTTTLLLKPYNGNNVNVNGVPLQLPSAGITYTLSGLAASTLYYVYLSGTTAVPVLTVSATGHSQAPNGVETKTGDVTQTLVGMVYTNASTQFVDSLASRTCLNWFNRRNLPGANLSSSAFTFTSTTSVEASSTLRAVFLTWADDGVDISASGYVTSSALSIIGTQLFLDGAQAAPAQQTTIQSNAQSAIFSSRAVNFYTEGVHTASLFVSVPSGGATGTLQTIQTDVIVRG